MEEIKDEIARRRGYPNWEEMENWYIDNNMTVNAVILIRSAMEEVVYLALSKNKAIE